MPNLSKIEELFKSFLAAHPHLLAETETAAADVAEAVAVPGPETFYNIIRALVPLIPGLDGTAQAEAAAAVDRHQAEHAQLTAAVLPQAAPETEGVTS